MLSPRILDELEETVRPDLSRPAHRVRVRVWRSAPSPGPRGRQKDIGPVVLQPVAHRDRVRDDRPAAGSEEEPGPSGPSSGCYGSSCSTGSREVQGEIGGCVGNTFPFEGLPAAATNQIIELMSSGDVGYFDNDGLLYVSGRDDE